MEWPCPCTSSQTPGVVFIAGELDTHSDESRNQSVCWRAFAEGKGSADILTVHYEACKDIRAATLDIPQKRVADEDRTGYFTEFPHEWRSCRKFALVSRCDMFLVMTVHSEEFGGTKS